MFARIARQYRRFLFGGLFVSLFMGLAVLSGTVDWPAEMSRPIIGTLTWGIVLILIIGIPIVVLSLLLPGLLPLIELWLITILVLCLIDPLVRPVITGFGLPGWSYCILLGAAFLVVERSLYGPWLANLWRRNMKAHSATLTVPGTPEEIWRKLYPDTAHSESFFWPGASFPPAPDGSDADMLMRLPRHHAAKDAFFELHIKEARAPDHFLYEVRPLPGCEDPRQRIEVKITPLDETQSRVTYTQQFLDLSFGKRLFFYLHNDFRDTLASLRARLSGHKDRSIQGSQMLCS
ncbi:hypothetical protein ROG8370_01942 [Roseovarius gaetbuli]|uniref:Polyketide cyclase / dehydrase and lipid transport n=1 Tax=Roseovarius gaetbuli TaxID=1356575 RepID=A0A1X6ZA06_9RHOB|nr:hypothetical protein [Roseovarius gaetbuli]SLN45408.1 hypothetical protein ROG8370_01942 [Roseovarius gaetbuli]